MSSRWPLAVGRWQEGSTNGQLPAANFSPAWFLRGPHAQTVWGRIARPRQLVKLRREVLVTPDDDDLLLDHLDGCSGGRSRPPAPEAGAATQVARFVLLHGLEGSSYSVYMQG